MSKAEDLSRQYREYREQCGIKDPIMLNEIEEAYYEGYHQAEKDSELTWEDIDWIVGEAVYRVSEDSDAEQICKEVLKRFKERKIK